MKPKLIAQGAEAKIYLTISKPTNNPQLSINSSAKDGTGQHQTTIMGGHFITKHRLKKSYRHPQLDESIRKSRTKRESKLLTKAGQITNIPQVLNQDKINITMQHIQGDRLSETLNTYPKSKQLQLMKQLGEQVAQLHQSNIIHGDLTTSNVILQIPNSDRQQPISDTNSSAKGGRVGTSSSSSKIFIIDFGLGFISARIEDKAVDIHLIKQALEAKHYQNHEKLFKEFLKEYKYEESPKVLEQLKKVEGRGRYKH